MGGGDVPGQPGRGSEGLTMRRINKQPRKSKQPNPGSYHHGKQSATAMVETTWLESSPYSP